MATVIKSLEDDEGNIILPKSRSIAITMNDDTTVEATIKNINDQIGTADNRITTIDGRVSAHQTEINNLKSSVSSGKSLVAAAITDKRVPTVATASFQEMANNISAIILGSGNAIASDVLTGKTFTNNGGVELTGTMSNRGSVGIKTLTKQGQEYVIPNGFHNGSGRVKTSISGLVGSNIVEGAIVGDVRGTTRALTVPSRTKNISFGNGSCYQSGNCYGDTYCTGAVVSYTHTDPIFAIKFSGVTAPGCSGIKKMWLPGIGVPLTPYSDVDFSFFTTMTWDAYYFTVTCSADRKTISLKFKDSHVMSPISAIIHY